MGDLQALADSIAKQGLLQPIGITEDRVLVFGERRLLACRDVLGLHEIEARTVNVTSIVEGERDENEVRKDFTVSEQVAIGRAVEAQVGNRRGQRTDATLPQNFAEVAKGKETRQIAAEKAGFANAETYRQAKAVVDKGIPELVEKVDRGEVAVSAAAIISEQPAASQRRLIQEEKLADAVKEYREAKKLNSEAKAEAAARKPLPPEEVEERQRVFAEQLGTIDDRAIAAQILELSEALDGLPAPEVAADQIPPALRHSIVTADLRKVAQWIDVFCKVWDRKAAANDAA